MERIFQSWAGLASHLIGECFDHAKPLIDADFAEIDPLVRFVAAQLFIDCHLTSESALILIREGKEWDADLVSRAVMEGSFKFTYMLRGNRDEVRKKVVEYWETLPNFAAIKHSERAKRFLEDVSTPEDMQWQPFRELILEEPAISKLRQGHTRKQRQALEEAWSFAGICKEFAKSRDDGLYLLAHLVHGYGMSSHLLHKDGDGIGMVWERYGRDPQRQTAVRLGHSGRVVSDICAFAKLRLMTLLRFCGKPTGLMKEIEEKYTGLSSALARAGERFTEIEYADGNKEKPIGDE